MTRKPKRRKLGRRHGSVIAIERDKQRWEVAISHGLRLTRVGPYTAAHWAVVATAKSPIKPEDIEGLVTVAGTDITFTASTLRTHIEVLTHKVDRTPLDSSPWLHASALAIKAVILAVRTGNIEAYCHALDALVWLGWQDVLQRLTTRIDDLARSNVPPFEGELAREGQRFLNPLRATAAKRK
jgi:hypothetical protein